MFKPNQVDQLQADKLQTPHSGYHWDGNAQSYFEGWYLKLTLPEIKQTFAFMYSLEDPLGRSKKAQRNNSGGAVQILGIDEEYLCRTFPHVKGFWADKHSFSFGHWGKRQLDQIDRDRPKFDLKPQALAIAKFNEQIQEGYQVKPNLNQGSIYNPKQQNYCRWQYQIKPIYGWGKPQSQQQATGGLLSYLPLYNPGWQITMAHGLATGWVEWGDRRYNFSDAPAYSEKNWGTSFPSKWFWLNCNSFENQSELAVTAAGGVREILGWQETVGLIGIHYQGEFYEFAPWNSKISWNVAPWGNWQVKATSDRYSVSLIGSTDLNGSYVRTPTAKGLVLNCRDTNRGKLSIELRNKHKTIVKAESDLAGLEVGGEPWQNHWIVGVAEERNELANF